MYDIYIYQKKVISIYLSLMYIYIYYINIHVNKYAYVVSWPCCGIPHSETNPYRIGIYWL